MSMRSILAVIAVFLFCLCAVLPETSADEVRSNAAEAAFLFRFPSYTVWPMGVWETDDDPMLICMLGEDPFDEDLERILEKSCCKQRPASVTHIEWPSNLDQCNVLFISSSEAPHLVEILDQTRSLPVLTVGNAPGFAEAGIMINMLKVDDVTSFVINDEVSRRSGLKMSARLYSIAHQVIRDTRH